MHRLENRLRTAGPASNRCPGGPSAPSAPCSVPSSPRALRRIARPWAICERPPANSPPRPNRPSSPRREGRRRRNPNWPRSGH
ncbi:MAG: hypothetical protein AMJ65_02000 [Phycisphaerae bacterium SG8_4]|nr:MAG: hypothetical protein AMJ65_02000 [Phycisphaerae bacterium SG8_4]